jgi:hypothetical protein
MGNDRSLDWLIPQRSLVQDDASELLDLIKNYKDKFSGDEDTEDVAALLVGAAFSLWRAVFLAPKNPTPRLAIVKKGRKFLEKFLHDNSISYGDEKNNRKWVLRLLPQQRTVQTVSL